MNSDSSFFDNCVSFYLLLSKMLEVSFTTLAAYNNFSDAKAFADLDSRTWLEV